MMRRVYESDIAMAMGVLVAMQLCGLLVVLQFVRSLA
jgi:hypothetical protein